jgi:hypothetical protein
MRKYTILTHALLKGPGNLRGPLAAAVAVGYTGGISASGLLVVDPVPGLLVHTSGVEKIPVFKRLQEPEMAGSV